MTTRHQQIRAQEELLKLLKEQSNKNRTVCHIPFVDLNYIYKNAISNIELEDLFNQIDKNEINKKTDKISNLITKMSLDLILFRIKIDSFINDPSKDPIALFKDFLLSYSEDK